MGLTAYRFRLLALLMFIGTISYSAPIAAQTDPDGDPFSEDEPLDPDQPLTEFPDFGVEWPDLDEPLSPEPDQGDEDERDLNETDAGQEADQQDIGADDSAAVDTAEIEQDRETFRPVDALAETEYDIRFSGLPENLESDFSTRFDALSALEQYRGDEANFAQIKRRAESDRELVERLMRIDGYFDAVVRARFENLDESSSGKIAVIIDVQPGPQYRLDDITLDGLAKAASEDQPELRRVFGLETGDIADSDKIVGAQFRLDAELGESGYPFAEVSQPELTVDHAERKGDLLVPLDPGGRYNFGSVVMEDTKLFGPEHVQMISRFDEGDLYRESDVEDLRRALIATGLVSTVVLEPVVSDDPELVNLAVNVTPAPLRTIAGELGYGTGEGARAEVSWEHRNFFPPEGLIRLAAVAATQEQAGSVTFRRNNFRRRDNVLNARVIVSNIDRDAFAARTFAVSANLERQSNLIFQKRWSWSAGIELLASDERDVVGPAGTTSRQTFFIAALPGTVNYDTSDDLLDPTTGFRIGARVSPEASLQNGSFYYVRGQIDGSAYFPVSESVVMAGRVRLGSIFGAGNNRIAPSRRLYAGGGGSVRGYGFQRIGPRDANNDPVGGRSLVEFSLEARVKTGLFGGNLGVVPFFDAGNVYTDQLPSFDGLRYGAGLGVRYYSNFGPIRIDVGTPINPQPGDSRIAVYVSLGQAF